MKNYKNIYLLLAIDGIKKHKECVFEKKEDAENYATFLISNEFAKDAIIREIKYWYE